MTSRAWLALILTACGTPTPPPTGDSTATLDTSTSDTSTSDTGTAVEATPIALGNRWELERRAALADCVSTRSIPFGPGLTRTWHDSDGWPVAEVETVFEYPGEIAQTLTTYERVDGLVVSSVASYSAALIPGTRENLGDEACEQVLNSSTTVKYDEAQRPVSYTGQGVNVCGEAFETDGTYTYTVVDDVLLDAVEQAADGTTLRSWTFDTCAMATAIDNVTYSISYRGDCDVEVVEGGGRTVEWEELRPQSAFANDALVDRWTYACGMGTPIPDEGLSPVDPRTEGAFAPEPWNGSWTPAWIGQAIEASAESDWTPMVITFPLISSDRVVMRWEDDVEDPCRMRLDMETTTWNDPAFEVVDNTGATSFGIGPVTLRQDEDSGTSVAITLAGSIAADLSELEDYTMTILVDVDTLQWTGFGDVDAICAMADDEGTPCVPCGSGLSDRCLELRGEMPARLRWPSGNGLRLLLIAARGRDPRGDVDIGGDADMVTIDLSGEQIDLGARRSTSTSLAPPRGSTCSARAVST